MKFSLARGALALSAIMTLASCGGGGDKATFPINVNVTGVQYPGLVFTTNDQDVAVTPPSDPTKAVDVVFPKEIEYGQVYSVVPKGALYDATSGTFRGGNTPKHQNCGVSQTYPQNLPTSGTAGQFAKIQMYFVCYINTYQLTAKVTGLKAAGLVFADGSAQPRAATPPTDTAGAITGAEFTQTLNPVAYNATYGVTVLTQPTGQTCTVANGVGIMDDAAEATNGVSNLVVTCVDNPK
jgi:hypothetical protein